VASTTWLHLTKQRLYCHVTCLALTDTLWGENCASSSKRLCECLQSSLSKRLHVDKFSKRWDGTVIHYSRQLNRRINSYSTPYSTTHTTTGATTPDLERNGWPAHHLIIPAAHPRLYRPVARTPHALNYVNARDSSPLMQSCFSGSMFLGQQSCWRLGLVVPLPSQSLSPCKARSLC
jgi:hypothetical protein